MTDASGTPDSDPTAYCILRQDMRREKKAGNRESVYEMMMLIYMINMIWMKVSAQSDCAQATFKSPTDNSIQLISSSQLLYGVTCLGQQE